MKIYVLLRQNYEGSDTVCVSVDINEISTSISLPSYEELTDIIQKHYESNNIPEHIFAIAYDELKEGYYCIIKKQKEIMWQIEVNTEWER